MADQYSADWARDIIDKGVGKAKGIMDDPNQLNDLLAQLQEKLAGLPQTVSTAFDNVPLMASMVKSYITREYTEVSPKVVISLVSAFAYLVKQKDLIPDNIPIVGLADDVAVATVAMAINEPELKAYAEWRAANAPQQAAPVAGAEASAPVPANLLAVEDVEQDSTL